MDIGKLLPLLFANQSRQCRPRKISVNPPDLGIVTSLRYPWLVVATAALPIRAHTALACES
jgi:hypothetical protein